MKLFESIPLGKLQLTSRIAMAPLTRCRAVDQNTPNEIMVEYYRQRAGAGLIIAEGTSPSPNGLGYRNIPGLFNQRQLDGWSSITKAVHEKGGRIFLQIMHTGRVGHTNNLPEGARLLAPSAIAQKGEISTYALGKQPYPTPEAMTTQEVHEAIQEFRTCTEMAIEAGFDGVEIHGAHGYLPNQFLLPSRNQRTDEFGGSRENRLRFLKEVLSECCAAVGSDKVGLRISPFSYADVDDEEQELIETYTSVVEMLNPFSLAYLHLSHMGDPVPVKFEMWQSIRKIYQGTLMLCGDFTKETAETALQESQADMIAFGRDYISNPDLVERFKNDWPLSARDNSLWYGDGAEGYSDYPNYNGE
ncbi:MAG: alkene reductase [Fluviicola sp. XM-24bin1]|nr:MAG: alkene reductase [Fluviicola sp. XM-24bin1]